MKKITIPDVTHDAIGLDGVVWNVLGQVYIPKHISADVFCWYAIFPEETFVPPHTHTEQDEFLMPLDGDMDVVINGKQSLVRKGETGHLPRGIPHSFFNNSGKPITALFWAEPAGQLVELYRKLNNVGNARDAVAMAPSCGVIFEPPVSSAL
ncbi:MAG TPA: cupin domain-containing protein [Oceanospirillaceae bacterium]|nr:cupin domain-containing protein [Oceanospirillaceae bacterium]